MQSLPHERRLVDNNLLCSQQFFEHMNDEGTVGLICARKHPYQFNDGRNSYEAGILRRERTDQSGSFGGLGWIVLRDKANEDVCIETDHRAEAPRSAIASFISAIVTGFLRLGRIPFRDCMEVVAGITS